MLRGWHAMVRVVRSAFFILLGVVVQAAQPHHARAQDHARARLGVTYPATDPECLVPTALASGVAARLGYDPFDDAATDSVTVHVLRRSSSSLSARVAIAHGTERGGQRDLQAHSCDELRDLVELTIALALDPLAGTAQHTISSQPAPLPPQIAAPTPPPPPASREVYVYIEAPPAPHSVAHASVGATLNLSTGIAPAPSFGIGLLTGLMWEHFGFLLEVRGDISASKQFAGGTASASDFVAAVFGCVRLSAVHVCVGARGGAQWNRGDGYSRDLSFSSASASLALRASYNIAVSSHWDLALGLEVAGALTRTTFLVDETAVWTTPPIALGVSLGPIYRFP